MSPLHGSIEHEYNRRAYGLRQLNFMRKGDDAALAYDSYLGSKFWREAGARYTASGRPRYCFICGDSPAELHHVTYARLGRERPEDLVALCRSHHHGVTTLIDTYRYSFAYAHEHERSAWWKVRESELLNALSKRVVAPGSPFKGQGPLESVRLVRGEYCRAPILCHCRPQGGAAYDVFMTFPGKVAGSDFVLFTTLEAANRAVAAQSHHGSTG